MFRKVSLRSQKVKTALLLEKWPNKSFQEMNTSVCFLTSSHFYHGMTKHQRFTDLQPIWKEPQRSHRQETSRVKEWIRFSESGVIVTFTFVSIVERMIFTAINQAVVKIGFYFCKKIMLKRISLTSYVCVQREYFYVVSKQAIRRFTWEVFEIRENRFLC